MDIFGLGSNCFDGELFISKVLYLLVLMEIDGSHANMLPYTDMKI